MTGRAFLAHMELIVAVFAINVLASIPVAAVVLIRDAILDMRAA